MKIVSSTRGRTAQSNDAPINLWRPSITSLKIRIKHWLSCDTDLYVTGAINKINQFTFLRVRTSLNYAEPWLAALETPVLLRRGWHFVSLFIRVKKTKQKNSQTHTTVGAHRKVKVIRMNLMTRVRRGESGWSSNSRLLNVMWLIHHIQTRQELLWLFFFLLHPGHCWPANDFTKVCTGSHSSWSSLSLSAGL